MRDSPGRCSLEQFRELPRGVSGDSPLMGPSGGGQTQAPRQRCSVNWAVADRCEYFGPVRSSYFQTASVRCVFRVPGLP